MERARELLASSMTFGLMEVCRARARSALSSNSAIRSRPNSTHPPLDPPQPTREHRAGDFMKTRISVSVAAFVLIVAGLVALGARLGLPCGPSTCLTAGWLSYFQNMIAGSAAVAAAGIAAFGPEDFCSADLQRQSHRSSAATTSRSDIVMHASHISAELLNIKEARKKRSAIAYGIHVPRLQSIIKQARVMLQSVGGLLAGPDDITMLRVIWRVSPFRSAVEGAANLAELFEHERDEAGTEFIGDARR